MKLLIVRHGDPDYSIDSLTETGWIEAELLSDRVLLLPQRAGAGYRQGHAGKAGAAGGSSPMAAGILPAGSPPGER